MAKSSWINKMALGLLICLGVLQHVGFTSGYDLSEIPDFTDRDKWIFVEEHPLVHPRGVIGYEIGRTKKYRHVTNNLLVGFEEFVAGNEKSIWKRWGFERNSSMYHALRKKNSEEWIIGPPGSHWQATVVYDGIILKGVWFILFIPSQGEAAGRYFSLPITPLKPAEPMKKGTGA